MRIDLRSDTVTKPTEAMRRAMAEAEVGDDVYGEDPTVNRLEECAAEILGKEAALFVTSGTQGNQIAILCHAGPGDEIILEADSHIFYYEAGAASALAGVQTRPLPGRRGMMDPADVEGAIRGDDIHFPRTALICLENTHNRAGGAVLPLDRMAALREVADHRIPVHLDGARLFNAAVAMGVDVREFARFADSVSVCLSKGLGAPVGSLLAGEKAFIDEARQWRKRLGGGMRQAGVIAAPALLALTEWWNGWRRITRMPGDWPLPWRKRKGFRSIRPRWRPTSSSPTFQTRAKPPKRSWTGWPRKGSWPSPSARPPSALSLTRTYPKGHRRGDPPDPPGHRLPLTPPRGGFFCHGRAGTRGKGQPTVYPDQSDDTFQIGHSEINGSHLVHTRWEPAGVGSVPRDRGSAFPPRPRNPDLSRAERLCARFRVQ